MHARSLLRFFSPVAALALIAAGCGSESPAGGDDDQTELVVYSGRNEELVGPLIERFRDATGTTVDVRYGDTAELAALILDEGDNSPADVFFGQDAGALGALSEAGVLATLDKSTLGRVPERYRSTEGEWVGTSGRARVVVYNTQTLAEGDLPSSVREFTDPRWAGRVGWAPTNASFQAFVTALRVRDGDGAAREWLTAMQANDTQPYDNNSAIVDAVAAGEIDAGLVNHYYLYPKLAEDPDLPAANRFYGDGDPGGLVNVAGAAILRTAENADAAGEFVDYLLSDEGQTYFTEQTWEYPLVGGVPAPQGLPELASLTPPDLDLSQLDDLAGTLTMLQETGVL